MVPPQDERFPIVGLGASAGGIEALTKFFQGVETLHQEPAMAFVVILHLLPDEESQLAALLRHVTRMAVVDADENIPIEPGHVYVIRPNQTLTVKNGRLSPRDRDRTVMHHPVDDLFRSMAKDYGPRAVAIVLSGTGANGSAGLAAIKEAGGIVVTQSPDSADFSDMPRHAINTGLVDAVLRPNEMIEVLSRYAEHLRQMLLPPPPNDIHPSLAVEEEIKPPASTKEALDSILGILRSSTGIDFRQYKAGTLQRRIDRRVSLRRLNDWQDYAEILRDEAAERESLANDLLITVTSFFRDADAWDALRDSAIRPLIAAHRANEPFRAWVAGCASGEEAYSLAMLLFEELKAQGKTFPIDIFATDASNATLMRARHGLYPAAAIEHLSEQRRQSFFRLENDRYRIKNELRETVVFAPQNLTQDPPFSRIKILICRNVLIYIRPEIQQKLIRLFHFSLSEGGYLFLGSAESIAGSEELFEVVSKKWRIYRRLGPTRHEIVDFPVLEGRAPSLPDRLTGGRRSLSTIRATEIALKSLADRHAPPSVVIDHRFNVLYYHGATGEFLKPQSGEPTQDLLVLARDGLGLRLRRLVEKAIESRSQHTARTRLLQNGRTISVLIEVSPIGADRGEGLLLVSFMEEKPPPADTTDSEHLATSREHDLEAEIRELKEAVRTTVIESNRAQEEFRAYNEEATSMNEELRSANEELETSKEELQSLNEELNTVNTQLRTKVDELHERTGDLNNLLSSTDIATLFLNPELHIRWFSPGVKEVFNVRESDINRPISDLVQKFNDDTFVADCQKVLRTLTMIDKQVRAKEGRWFTRRVVPYRTVDDRIDGVVVTFTDVSAIQAARNYAETIVQTVPIPLIVLDQALRVISANPAFYRTFAVAPSDTEHRLIYDLGNGQWNIPELRRLLTDILPHETFFNDFEITHNFEHIGYRAMRLSGRKIDDLHLILLAIQDVTAALQAGTQP